MVMRGVRLLLVLGGRAGLGRAPHVLVVLAALVGVREHGVGGLHVLEHVLRRRAHLVGGFVRVANQRVLPAGGAPRMSIWDNRTASHVHNNHKETYKMSVW